MNEKHFKVYPQFKLLNRMHIIFHQLWHLLHLLIIFLDKYLFTNTFFNRILAHYLNRIHCCIHGHSRTAWGLKCITNELACFHRCFRSKTSLKKSTLWNFCLWGCSQLLYCYWCGTIFFLFVLCGKKLWLCRECRYLQVMQICTTASYKMLCHGITEHQNLNFFFQGRIPWNPATGPQPKDTW